MKLSLYLIIVRDDFTLLLSLKRIQFCPALVHAGSGRYSSPPLQYTCSNSALLQPCFQGKMTPSLRLVQAFLYLITLRLPKQRLGHNLIILPAFRLCFECGGGHHRVHSVCFLTSLLHEAVFLKLWMYWGASCPQQLCPKSLAIISYLDYQYVFWAMFHWHLGHEGLELKFLSELWVPSQTLKIAIFPQGLFSASVFSNDACGQNSHTSGLPSVERCCSIPEKLGHWFSKYGLITLGIRSFQGICEISSFSITYPNQARFSLFSTRMSYDNRLNADADMKSQLFSTEPDVKEICKNIKQCYSFSLNYFCFRKQSYF